MQRNTTSQEHRVDGFFGKIFLNPSVLISWSDWKGFQDFNLCLLQPSSNIPRSFSVDQISWVKEQINDMWQSMKVYLKEWFWCDYSCCNQMPPRRKAPWRNRAGLFGFLAFGENLLQTFRFATLPISFVSETKSGPCPTLTIRGFLAIVSSYCVASVFLPLALAVFLRHLIQWWFDLILFRSAAVDKQIHLQHILSHVKRFATFDWANRQTIQREIHFRLKLSSSALSSNGKVARLFKINFLLWTVKESVRDNLMDPWFLPPKTSTELSLSYPLFNSRNEIQSYLRHKCLWDETICSPIACYILQTRWSKLRCWRASLKVEGRTCLHFVAPVCLSSCCPGTDKKQSSLLIGGSNSRKGERYMTRQKSFLQWPEGLPILPIPLITYFLICLHTHCYFGLWLSPKWLRLVAKSWWRQAMYNSSTNECRSIQGGLLYQLVLLVQLWAWNGSDCPQIEITSNLVGHRGATPNYSVSFKQNDANIICLS